VVKAFYLAFAAQQIADGELEPSEEFYRAARDMIVDSSNDATGYVLDTLCGTTPGPELPPAEIEEFMHRRGAVNRFFESRGYTGVMARQRTYNEGPYGREKFSMGANNEYRNMVTPEACVRLFCDLADGRFGGPEQQVWMRSLLGRCIPADGECPDEQSTKYIGAAIPAGSRLYSKAGWTSEVRHDVAWVVLPAGRELALGIFTEGASGKEIIVPQLAKQLIGNFVSDSVG
jgi:hypothetical protein